MKNYKYLVLVILIAATSFMSASCGKKSGDVCLLTILVSGDGRVNGPGGYCVGAAQCDYYVDKGSVVFLSAIAYNNWRFSQWQGSITGSSPNVAFTMNSNYLIRAVFLRGASEGDEESVSGPCPDGSIKTDDACITLNNDILRAHDLLSGITLWDFNADETIICGPVLTEEGILYLGTGSNILYGIDAATGKEVYTGDISDITAD